MNIPPLDVPGIQFIGLNDGLGGMLTGGIGPFSTTPISVSFGTPALSVNLGNPTARRW